MGSQCYKDIDIDKDKDKDKDIDIDIYKDIDTDIYPEPPMSPLEGGGPGGTGVFNKVGIFRAKNTETPCPPSREYSTSFGEFRASEISQGGKASFTNTNSFTPPGGPGGTGVFNKVGIFRFDKCI